MSTRRIQNAYVIYDFEYHDTRKLIHDWLQQQERLEYWALW